MMLNNLIIMIVLIKVNHQSFQAEITLLHQTDIQNVSKENHLLKINLKKLKRPIKLKKNFLEKHYQLLKLLNMRMDILQNIRTN